MVSTSENDDLLADLFRHPGWAELELRLVARKDFDTKTLALATLTATTLIDQRKVDETRGFWRGADWFLKETKRGARAYERTNNEDGESK